MSCFNSCYRVIFKSGVSYAWIALHRCVEAYARSSGNNFCSIFDRLETEFHFDRRVPDQWPDLEKIRQIATKLKLERDDYMEKMNSFISERREEKKKGKRISTNREFLTLAHMQTEYTPPRVGCWGWKKQS